MPDKFMRLGAVSRKGDDHDIVRVAGGELLKAFPGLRRRSLARR